MSENKFLAKMRGEKAPKSLIEVKNDKFSTPFVDLPKSTSVTDGFDNEAEHSIVVAKSAQNWALQKSGIELLADAESADYTGRVPIAGHGMWVNSSYTFPLSEEPANPVVAIINPCAKWVLNFVGKDLFSQNDTIGFTLVVKVGATHISNIDCEVKRQAGFFCKKFVIDFSESEQELIKVNGGDTLTVQLVCNDDTASAVYYTGVSVLSLLQRKVDGDVVAGNTKTFGDLVEDVYNLEEEINNTKQDFAEEINGIKEEINNKFLGVYRFKGTVPSYANLPASNNVVGDTYNIGDTGSNYTWDGTTWDKLSETVDLSNYATKDYIEEKIAGINTSISTLNNNLSQTNQDVDSLQETKQDIATAINYNNISNSITQIPQDIKLELNNGTLTLKAGSKVYVPNGSGVFNAVTTTADASTTRTDSQDCIVWRYPSGGLGIFPAQLFYSGATAPTQYQFMFWYDTTNNLCKYTSNYGSTWISGMSFPIGVVETDGTKISAIKQVFNGLGYVGSTVFALPGVKGLIPNGRNADGSLKSNVLNITSVKTYTITATTIKAIRITSSGLFGYQGYIVSDTKPSVYFNMWYNPVENIMYDTGGGTLSVLNATVGGSVEYDGTRITSFVPKTVFHAVDYNEFNEHRIVDFQKPTSSNNYTWYRKYSDGWVVQGGVVNTTVNSPNTITLPVKMADANYTPIGLMQSTGNEINGYTSEGWANRTTTSFQVYGHKASASITNAYSWVVFGYAA